MKELSRETLGSACGLGRISKAVQYVGQDMVSSPDQDIAQVGAQVTYAVGDHGLPGSLKL